MKYIPLSQKAIMRHQWFMTLEGLCKLCSKTNVKVVVGIKQKKGTFGSTCLKVKRQKIYCLHGEKEFPLIYASSLEMAAAPSLP